MTFFRRHPFIFSIIVGALLAIFVWLLVPKEYVAYTKLSDEHKEMDIAIGLGRIVSKMRKADESINNMEVYCKVLKTEDFARNISHKKVPQRNMNYGEYIGEQDTVKAILDRINYSYNSRHNTLVISFADKDPVIAFQMLDSITTQLQAFITEKQHHIAASALEDAIRERDMAFEKYQRAQACYSSYADAHQEPNIQAVQQQLVMLQNEVELTRQYYDKIVEICMRLQVLCRRPHISFTVVKSNSVPKKPKNIIWSYLICFICLSLVITSWIKGYQKTKVTWRTLDFGNLFAPWTITVLLWITVILCIYLLGDYLYPLTSQFYICISIWISLFCLSSFATYNFSAHSKNYTEGIKTLHLNKTIFYLLLIISLIFSPLCVKRVMDVISMFNTDNIMLAIRTVAIYGDGFGILDLCFVINKALLLVVLWRYPQVSAKTVLLILILLFLNSLAIMDKSTLFFIFVSFAFILYEKRKIRFIHIGICSVLVVALLFGLAVMRDSFVHKGSLDILLFLSEYIFANPVAFGYAHEAVSPQFGANTLFLLYYYLHRFDFGNYEVVDLVQEFSYVPIKTNLYTVMQPFYVDFGISGVAFFAILYGVGFGLCYRLYRNGNSSAKCIYTYLVYILLLQFGQEAIFLRPVEFLRLLLLVYLMAQRKFKLVLR